MDHLGRTVSEPVYDEIRQEIWHQWFLTSKQKYGLISAQGREIIPTQADLVQIFNDRLFFYKINNQLAGALLMPAAAR